MANAAIAADLTEALDRLGALAPEVAFDLEVGVDVALEARRLLVGQVLDLRVGREPELGEHVPGGRRPDALDVGQPDLEPLLVREVHSGDACH